jgi:hypothetical protein
MSKPVSDPISFADARKRAARLGQMSHAKPLGRFRLVPAAPDRGEFLAWWASLLKLRCGGNAADIAKLFTCTEQCARYWLDEFSCPNGLHVDLAMDLWPEDFAARHGFALQVAA